MDLEIDIDKNEKKSIVTLIGEIDIFTAPKLKKALLPLTQQGGHVLEVDFNQVSYMDSTGLGVFISALKSTKEHNSDMKIINLQERVLRLFTITGLDKVINIHPTYRSEG